MSRDFDSPVQTQMAVAVLNGTLSNEYSANNRNEGRPIGWKRVFVQTDNGSVLGIELDRGDNAHTVKKKMQLALNVPTEESCLTFGDRVLNNDLSGIRNDSPLLLTRSHMHRSCSTPCLSPTGKELQQRDRSGPIEILGCSSHCSRMKPIVKAVVKAIRNDVEPVLVESGMGGAYYFRNMWGEKVAIVKPTDEEPFAPNNPKGYVGKSLGVPGLKRSVRVGEAGFREVAAYLLDHDHFANVPPTVLVKITHSVFNVNDGDGVDRKAKFSDKKQEAVSKIASFQQYIPHDFDASDHGTSSFPVAAIHRIGILDIRIFNTDRHSGNLLVRKIGTGAGRFEEQTKLIPIDHGLCLPENLEDPYFEWIHWPQASIPFSEEELEYIKKLDPAKDAELLRMELPMIHAASLRVLVLSTTFLKEAASFGLCLSEIGQMMTRQFSRQGEEPSELEVLCIEAAKFVKERETFLPEVALVDDDSTQFYIDCDDDAAAFETPSPRHPGAARSLSRSPLSKLEEAVEEDEDDGSEAIKEEANTCTNMKPVAELVPGVSKLSTSLMGVSLAGKSKSAFFGVSKGKDSTAKTNSSAYANEVQFGSRSAKELLPPSKSFVTVSDMGSEEWGAFLEKFQELLQGAFHDRKCRAVSTRLGTSCQF